MRHDVGLRGNQCRDSRCAANPLECKELTLAEKATMIDLLHEYKDMFAWLHEDMKGVDPKFYQYYQLGDGCQARTTKALPHEPELHGSGQRRNR